VGHTGTYLSNICQDGSPIRMRLCLPGESGGVVSKYSPLSEYENFDWAIVPFEEYMHGLASADFAPMIGTPKLQTAIERYNFGPLFSRALKTSPGEVLPDGQWKAALATRFDRNIYIFTVTTSAADDAVIIAAFNAAPNKSRFNFFYRNCSNQAKAIFALILPQVDTIGDRTSGITMETPKGLAKALVNQSARPAICTDSGDVRQKPRRAFSHGKHVSESRLCTVVVFRRLPRSRAWRDVVSRSDLSVWDARVVKGFHFTEGRATHARATSTQTSAG
jgi:hypothetical protein